MIRSIFLFFLFLIAEQLLYAQEKMPTIKATSKSVDIKDAYGFHKNQWTIVPEAKPDVFETNTQNGKVTFYTDIDSISVVVKPTTVFDFTIILNDTAKAWTRIIYKPSYLDVLKNASAFNLNDNRSLPKFTYQDSSNPNLIALRKGLNLDSIAGQSTELQKILNLLHWIHNLIPHDGQHGNPEVRNAMSMISVCKKEARGLNCRGLATVLNESYLAMGIKSRFVTCLPKDSTDQECHVINLVFSKDLNKWLWIDPTNDAYIMNENGELLSIEEVRNRIIKEQSLIVNPDANWNKKEAVLKPNYLFTYMAKNLYRFECPVSSEYNAETQTKDKTIEYIQLNPLDYYKQIPNIEKHTNKTNNYTRIVYKTNNPTLFWQTP
ncbi:MAG: transglutaminase domain-containing protein [Bacteroidetes bacterium]|nr:transglutaminase domain-containing protein [Bacteroidota bacterium]